MMTDMQMVCNLPLQKIVFHSLLDLLHYLQLMLSLQFQKELPLELYWSHQIEHQFQQHTNDVLRFQYLMQDLLVFVLEKLLLQFQQMLLFLHY